MEIIELGENVVTLPLDKKWREQLQPQDSRVSAGCCWQLTAGVGKPHHPSPRRDPGERGLAPALLARLGCPGV